MTVVNRLCASLWIVTTCRIVEIDFHQSFSGGVKIRISTVLPMVTTLMKIRKLI